MANIDKISVKNTVYNIVSPAVVSDYIEVIGGACTKPDGYEEDEVILAKQNDVQLLFKATQDIAFGANIVENTNCVRTTLEEVLKNAGGGGGASSADQVSYDNSDSGLEAENVQEAVDELATKAGTASSQIQTLANNIDVLSENGAVNVIPFSLSEVKRKNTSGTWNNNAYTLNGITFTVNDDGSLVVDGTASARTTINIFEAVADEWLEKGLTYIARTYNAIFEDTTQDCFVQLFRSGSPWPVINKFDNTEFVVDNSYFDTSYTLSVQVVVNSGKTLTNQTIKPLIARASYNGVYAPYAKTNRQLTEDSVDWDNFSKLGAKNFLPNDAVSQTLYGITFTVNSDGSVTANGTGTASPVGFTICEDADKISQIFKVGQKYILSGLPSNGNCFIKIATTGGVSLWEIGSSEPEKEFIYNGENVVSIDLVVRNRATLSNVTFYPMIRLASDTDSTYQPYAKTNRELTEELQIQDLFNDAKVSGFSYFSGSYLLKYGKIVNLSFSVAEEVSTETKVLELPVGCRPKGNTIVPLYQNAVQYGTAWIKTDGDVTINPSEAKNYLGFSATFIASN